MLIQLPNFMYYDVWTIHSIAVGGKDDAVVLVEFRWGGVPPTVRIPTESAAAAKLMAGSLADQVNAARAGKPVVERGRE